MGCPSCGNVVSTCAETTPATCLYWEIPSEWQSYYDKECLDLDALLTTISENIKNIEDSLDFSNSFAQSCLTYPTELTAVLVAEVLDAEICAHEARIEDLEDICNILDKDISGCGLDFTCLAGTDPCGETITYGTLKEWMQTITNKLCALESPAGG